MHALSVYENVTIHIVSSALGCNPNLCREFDSRHYLSFHRACCNCDMSLDVISYLIKSYPNACKELNERQMHVIHSAISSRLSPEVICEIVNADPESLKRVNNNKVSALDLLVKTKYLKDVVVSDLPTSGIMSRREELYGERF